jgi:hypothetical protein
MQMDVKYVPEYVGGFRAYNYVIVDECSRWRHTKAYLEIGPKSTIDFMKDVKKYCPFPFHCIQTDNGFEFTNKYSAKAWSKKHPLDQWCEENEIEHKLIPPGEKELNGKVERSHRIDEQYFYWRAPTSHIDDFNEAQRAWMQTYNKDRPHGSLDFKTPIEKIMERIELFKQYSFIDKDYEYIKLKFLKETPISKLMVNYEKQEMRSMSFNRKLQALFKI